MDMIPRADHEAAVEEARSAATVAERERIAAILQSDTAKERPAAALRLALTPDVTPTLAGSLLEAIPAEAQSVPFQFQGQRSKDAPGGLALAIVDSASFEGTQAPSSDFERGRAAAKRFSHIQP